jgi:hypothetical protein
MRVRQLKRGVFFGAIGIAACFWAAASVTAVPPASADAPAARADGGYVGAAACAECHGDISRRHAASGMSKALEKVAECRILIANPRLSVKLGPYTYTIVREGQRSIYSVTDGVSTASAPIAYALGQGAAGQTYVIEYEGAFYETRVSYYTDVRTLGLTLGHLPAPPKSPAEALGRRMHADETRDCFSCHSTGGVEGRELKLERIESGVRCEACHGPGADHITSMKAGTYAALKIQNPGRLGGDELTQDFCGRCHRSAEQVVVMPLAKSVDNVRFQPYRIFGSRCYSDDARIRCTACHDPHESRKLETAFYDEKCLACHVTARGKRPQAAGLPSADVKPCPVGVKNCSSCHMPKIEVPGSHAKFTDHRIRVVKPGEAFPF